MSQLAPWCSGNILAFGANVGGSNPPGAVLSFKYHFILLVVCSYW